MLSWRRSARAACPSSLSCPRRVPWPHMRGMSTIGRRLTEWWVHSSCASILLAVLQVNAAVAARALASQKRDAPIADDIEDAEGAQGER